MKAKAIQISWHDTQPIYSAHFSPSHPNKLATAGGDNNVRIWRLDPPSTSIQPHSGVEGVEDDGFPRVTYLATLSRHTQAVNVVRWSPKGEVLASAGDDGNVLLWVPDTTHQHPHPHHQPTTSSPSTPSTPAPPTPFQLGTAPTLSTDKDPYRVKIMCRPPLPSEIYDLAWSPCGSFILTGSMDNVARIYRASDGTCVRQIAEHVHYVQGVAWDPRGEWVATQGSDRSVHVYSVVQQHEGKEKERGRTLEVGGGMKSSRMEVPGHLLPTTRPHLEHQTSNTSPIPAASPPGTPGLLCLNLGPGAVPTRMDPPLATPVSHSRRGSFSSMTSSSRRSVSPSPTSGLVLPAVANTRPGSSPKLGPTSSSSLPPLPAETGAAGAGIGVGAGMGVGVKGAKTMSLYANEQLLSFFRRLSWAPDGSLLFAPAGVWNPRLESSSHANPASGSGSGSATSVNASEEKKEVNTVYIYSRAGLGKPPVAHLPGQRKPAVAVRCSPIYYKLRPLDDSALEDDKADVVREGKPVFALPYRIIYAVATQDSVVIYDTQHPTPIAVASNLHYAGFTDLAWSGDGRWLVAVSGDGYASILVFEEGELGEVHPGPEGQGRRHRGSDAGERGRSGMSGMRVPVPPSPSRTSSSSSMVAGVPVSVSVPSGPPALASISSGTPPVTPAPVSGVVEKKEEGKEDGEAKEPEKKKRRVVPTLVSGLDGAPGPSGS